MLVMLHKGRDDIGPRSFWASPPFQRAPVKIWKVDWSLILEIESVPEQTYDKQRAFQLSVTQKKKSLSSRESGAIM